VQDSNTNRNHTHAQIFIFQADTPAIDDRQVCYLFSVRQVVEVLSHADARPVPLGPKHTDGITQWRGRVLPVVSLEKCLGIEASQSQSHRRAVVVRSVIETDGNKLNEFYGIITVGAKIQQVELPLACEPMALPAWVSDATLLSGVFQTPHRILLVVNIGRILNGESSTTGISGGLDFQPQGRKDKNTSVV
jgi:chemotaxis signal transduction protein